MELNMKAFNDAPQKKTTSPMLVAAQSSCSESDTPRQYDNRRKTDVFFLILFISCIILMIPLLIYTLKYTDVNRHRGYDSCGNICGRKNVWHEQWNCTGKDMTSTPVHSPVKGCIRMSSLEDIIMSLFKSSEEISVFASTIATNLTLASVVVLGIHGIVLVLFHYTTPAVVCITLLASYIYYPSLMLVLWLFFGESYFKITFVTIIIILLLCTLIFNRNQYRVFTTLLTAAVKAIFDMKIIIFVEVMILIMLVAILVAYSASTFYMDTAGTLTDLPNGRLEYISDGYMKTSIVLNSIVSLWAIQFLVAVEFMVVSGAVTKWYYSRKETSPKEAVLTTVVDVLKNHLGTAALGSFLITVMTPCRFILKCLSQFSILKGLSDYILIYLDGFFSDNAYILTGIYGTSYLESGKKVVIFSKSNMGKTEAINSFADFVVVSAQILIILLPFWPTFLLIVHNIYQTYDYVYLFLFEFGFAYVCGQAILGPIRIASNTIFFCVHQDCLVEHDVDSQPHIMTETMFLDGSNFLIVQKIQEKCM